MSAARVFGHLAARTRQPMMRAYRAFADHFPIREHDMAEFMRGYVTELQK